MHYFVIFMNLNNKNFGIFYLFTKSLLEFAWSKVYGDPKLPESVQNIGDGGVGVIKLLRLLHLDPSLPDQPG